MVAPCFSRCVSSDGAGMCRAGIDGGGVFKEFLTSLCKEVFDTDRGLWLANKKNELYPAPHSYATESKPPSFVLSTTVLSVSQHIAWRGTASSGAYWARRCTRASSSTSRLLGSSSRRCAHRVGELHVLVLIPLVQ